MQRSLNAGGAIGIAGLLAHLQSETDHNHRRHNDDSCIDDAAARVEHQHVDDLPDHDAAIHRTATDRGTHHRRTDNRSTDHCPSDHRRTIHRRTIHRRTIHRRTIHRRSHDRSTDHCGAAATLAGGELLA